MNITPLKGWIVCGLGIGLILAGCSSDQEKVPADQVKESESEVVSEIEMNQSAGMEVKEETQEKKNTSTPAPKPSVEEQKQALTEVQYYKEPPTENKKATEPKETPKAIDILKRIAKEKNRKITFDINHAGYRQFVYFVAAEAASLSKVEADVIAQYVKYVDQYENKLKNDRIKLLEGKLKNGTLTKEELTELKGLLPISKGIKLIPELDKPDDSNPKDDGLEDKKNPKQPDEGETDPEKGKEKEGQEPAEGEQPQDPPSQDDGDEEQEGSEEEKDEDSEKEEESPQPEQPPVNKGNYNVQAAVDYAYKWWDKRNNEEYGYYSKVSNCEDCWADCTNFVSQVIQAGGVKEVKTGFRPWFYSDEKPAFAWGIANAFYQHFVERVEQAKKKSEIDVGDIVSVDFDKDGDIEHSAVVTKKENGKIYATYHSNDRKDMEINYWLTHYDVYAFKMQTVQ